VTVAEAARVLGVSSQRVKQHIASGRIVAYKIGSHWDVSPESVAAFTPGKPGRPARKEG